MELKPREDSDFTNPSDPDAPPKTRKEDDEPDPIIKTGPVTNAEPPWNVLKSNEKVS